MPLTRVTLWGYYCERCGHRWVPRGLDQVYRRAASEPRLDADDPGDSPGEPNEEPTVCPACKSPYWNKPRKDAIPTKTSKTRSK